MRERLIPTQLGVLRVSQKRLLVVQQLFLVASLITSGPKVEDRSLRLARNSAHDMLNPMPHIAATRRDLGWRLRTTMREALMLIYVVCRGQIAEARRLVTYRTRRGFAVFRSAQRTPSASCRPIGWYRRGGVRIAFQRYRLLVADSAGFWALRVM